MGKLGSCGPMDKSDQAQARVAGSYASCLSIRPLQEATDLAQDMVTYLENLRQKHGGESIFKIHAGLRTVACLDHISAVFYFGAPQTILEREEHPRFGPFAVRPEIIGGSCPTLVASGSRHHDARHLTDAILQFRANSLAPALERATVRIIDKLRESAHASLYDVLQEWSANVATNWLLDTDIELENINAWTNGCFTFATDTFVTEMLGRNTLPKCPHQALQTQAAMRSAVEASPVYSSYQKLAEEHGVPLESLADFLVFLTLFSATGAPMLTLYYAIPQVYANPVLLSELRHQLRGSQDDILENQLLDNVLYETARMNAVPRVYYKRAQQGFSMPKAKGGSVWIKEGTLVLIPATISHRDPTVFQDPHTFNPSRFEKDPCLKDKVFAFGITKDSQNPYGCAAGKSGQAQWLLKNMFATFISRVDFEFVQPPTFDPNSLYSLYPKNLRIHGISVDGCQTNGREFSECESLFLQAADRVRGREVKFDRRQYLQLYGLYKQALVGDNKEPKSACKKGFEMDKWIYWNRVKGLSKNDAMLEYVRIFEENAGGVSPSPVKGETPQSPKDLKAVREQQAPNIQPLTDPPSTEPLQNIQVAPLPKAQGGSSLVHFTMNCGVPDIDSSLRLDVEVHFDDESHADFAVFMSRHQMVKRLSWSVHLPMTKIPHIIVLTVQPEQQESLGNWFVEEIRLNVKEVDLSYRFVHGGNIIIPSDRIVLFEASGCLPPSESACQRKARENHVERMRDLYQWQRNGNLPSHVSSKYLELPLEDHLNFGKGFGAETPESQRRAPLTSFREFELSVEENCNRAVPRLAKDDLWRSDAEFGRLFLQGSHNNFIKECTKLPVALNVNPDFIVEKTGSSLQDMIDHHLLFLCDYEILKGTNPPEGRYLAAPIVLFFSDTDRKQLLPILIQIERAADALVFTPADTEADWLLAKMWVRVADIAVHQLSSHFLLTHGAVEAFAVAAFRTFAPNHPIFQLLRPHFQTTFGINALAREVLISKGGWIDRFFSFAGEVQDQVMERSYKTTSLRTYMNLPRDLESRGVNHTSTLPEYPYRDDGLLVWEAIATYVSRVVSIFYHCDEEVASDSMLESWLVEFEQVGYQQSDWGGVRGLRDLEDLLTSILFTATASHGCMNTMQYEVYGFPPASPATMYTAPPKVKGATKLGDIAPCLNGKETAPIFMFLSDHFSDEDVKLGHHSCIWSNNADVGRAFLEFRRNLEIVESKIAESNKSREVPYTCLLPSRIPNSIDL